jgi:hypothetical protein
VERVDVGFDRQAPANAAQVIVSRRFDTARLSPQSWGMDAMARRLLEALEMWEDGVQIMRENLRRRSPGATDEDIATELDRWLAGADPLDSEHVLVAWPRRPR